MRLCKMARFCAFCVFVFFMRFSVCVCVCVCVCVFFPCQNGLQKKTQICAEFCKNVPKTLFLMQCPFSYTTFCMSPNSTETGSRPAREGSWLVAFPRPDLHRCGPCRAPSARSLRKQFVFCCPLGVTLHVCLSPSGILASSAEK